jgi:two-component system response regulator YesN
MYTVMIADDYEAFRHGLKSMEVWGEVSGFTVTEEAANGQEALRKLRANPVDLLLTDIRMPIVDGLELIDNAAAQSLCDCIVIMSQFTDFEYARKGLSSGAMDYLLKPVDPGQLLKVLARASAFIAEKRQTQSRMTYLENILKKGAQDFFPEKELDRLLMLIGEGSRAAPGAASDLVDGTYAELDLDCLKTARILNRVLKKVIDFVQAEFPWIPKFYNLQELKLNDFARLCEIVPLKEAFVGKIEALITMIRKLELDIDNDGMVRMACRTILDNIDTDITVGELSNRLFITRTYLSQVFREKTGITLVKYLTDVKIDRAKYLISTGAKNYELAEKLGYKDDEYFKKLFKKSTGMTINEYKSQI